MEYHGNKLYKYNIESSDIKLKVGDAVRLLIQRDEFETGKKDKPKWSRSVYYIVNKKGLGQFKISITS